MRYFARYVVRPFVCLYSVTKKNYMSNPAQPMSCVRVKIRYKRVDIKINYYHSLFNCQGEQITLLTRKSKQCPSIVQLKVVYKIPIQKHWKLEIRYNPTFIHTDYFTSASHIVSKVDFPLALEFTSLYDLKYVAESYIPFCPEDKHSIKCERYVRGNCFDDIVFSDESESHISLEKHNRMLADLKVKDEMVILKLH